MIYGIGVNWEGVDKLNDFYTNNRACVGYWEEDSSSYYQILRTINTGDIIYAKTSDWDKKTLTIHAIGIVQCDDVIPQLDDMVKYNCLKVKWKKLDKPKTFARKDTSDSRPKGDPYTNSVYGITLYPEYNKFIQKFIIDFIAQNW